MARRALVLGSQIDGLRGVENDTRQMAAMLDGRGFAVDVRVGANATRAGMLAGYDKLIKDSGPDDTAVVYYCGHGYYASVPAEKRAWQCIVPTDLREGTHTDWRGITAWELSIKQAQLTARTRNVTVVLDCCHAAQLSRSDEVAGAVARALPHPVHVGFDHHLAELRAMYGEDVDAVDPVGSPHAARVVACGQNESAFERPDADGQYHGVFTQELIEVLDQVGAAPVSWAAIISAVRTRVLRQFRRQRPVFEGPIRRAPFSLTEHDDACRVLVSAAGDEYQLSAGRLNGVVVGDIYGVMQEGAPVYDDADRLARLEVTEVTATMAKARRTAGVDPPARHAVAVPIVRRASRWPVAIDGPVSARVAIEAAIGASPTLRIADPCEVGVLATVRVDGDSATIEDATGPLFPPEPLASGLVVVVSHLANLGIAQGVRELEGEHGVLATELTIEFGTVHDGRARPLPDHGAVVGLHERYYLSVEARGRRTLFVHALSINARGKLMVLTDYDYGGVALEHCDPSVTIGRRADGALRGVGFFWPQGLPADRPRLTEFIVVATPRSTDLSGLETRELVVGRNSGNQIERALAALCDGKYRDVSGGCASRSTLDGFFLKRLSIWLDPGVAPVRDFAREIGQ